MTADLIARLRGFWAVTAQDCADAADELERRAQRTEQEPVSISYVPLALDDEGLRLLREARRCIPSPYAMPQAIAVLDAIDAYLAKHSK